MEGLLSAIETMATQIGEDFDLHKKLFVTPQMPLRPNLMGGSFWMTT